MSTIKERVNVILDVFIFIFTCIFVLIYSITKGLILNFWIFIVLPIDLILLLPIFFIWLFTGKNYSFKLFCKFYKWFEKIFKD